MHRLTAVAVRKVGPGKYADGGGLWLQVTPEGVRSWVFRYTRQGRERYMGLGATHTVSLADARQAALEARKVLAEGRDPIHARTAARAAADRIPTFREAAESHIAERSAGWRNAKHAGQWTSTLTAYAYPKLGSLPVDAITTEQVLAALRPIWASKTETASRVRQRIEAVLDAATVKGQREGASPARWRGHLDKLLPKPSDVRQVRHFPALPYPELPAFMARLRAVEAISARALEFLILTAARTHMVTRADWSEVSGEVWTVPRERMKAKRAHAIPLAGDAVALLDALPRLDGCGIFPGARGPHLSTGAMDKLLQVAMQRPDVTVHGFRSTFRDWAAEQTHFPGEVVEMALAHTIRDKTEAAYRRGDLMAKRRELMEAWAGYCRSAESPART